MHDTWKALGLSRINETRASEGEPPLKSAASACLILSAHLSLPSLSSQQAEGFAASWWRAKEASAMKNASALSSEYSNKKQEALSTYNQPMEGLGLPISR